MVERDKASTVAQTGALAVELDERQYERGYGPCLDCINGGEPLIVRDMLTDQRWPDWAQTAADLGARSSSVALANMRLYEAQGQVAEQLQSALQSRAVIEQAKGILMGQRGCSAQEAFDLLVRLSQDTNRKLRDVAQVLVQDAVSESDDGRARPAGARSTPDGGTGAT